MITSTSSLDGGKYKLVCGELVPTDSIGPHRPACNTYIGNIKMPTHPMSPCRWRKK